MKIEFLHRDGNDQFDEQKMQGRFRNAIAFFEGGLLELYTGVTKENF